MDGWGRLASADWQATPPPYMPQTHRAPRGPACERAERRSSDREILRIQSAEFSRPRRVPIHQLMAGGLVAVPYDRLIRQLEVCGAELDRLRELPRSAW